MKVLLISLIFFFTIVAEEKWKTFVDTTNKYSIEYPSNWEVQEIGERKALASPLEDEKDEFAENINVISLPFQKVDVTQPEFQKGMTDQLKSRLKGFKLLSATKAEINGVTMLKINYLTDYETIVLNLSQYIFSKDSRLYIVSVTVPEKGNPAFITLAEKVIGTIKTTK